MPDSLTVNVCVTVRADCPIRYITTTSDQAEFSFGGPRDGYDFAFDRTALTTFLALGADALAELDARATHEPADQAAPTSAPDEEQPA